VPSLLLSGPDDPDSGTPGSSDAVALFADRARASGVALSVDEQTGPLVVSVCRRLDGMPLAIEMAAARLRSMSLAELHGRLDQRFRLLTGGSRTSRWLTSARAGRRHAAPAGLGCVRVVPWQTAMTGASPSP
jgi:predicted ATPase